MPQPIAAVICSRSVDVPMLRIGPAADIVEVERTSKGTVEAVEVKTVVLIAALL